MNKGATIKTVIIGAVLAFCIAGVWMASSKETVAEGKAVVSTETAESVQKDIVIENPVHFGRTVPAWNKYEGIEVTSFGTHDTEGSNTDAGTVSTDTGSEMLGVSLPEEADAGDITGGDSESTEGTEYADEANEYYDAAQEIPVEEYVEEPVEEIPAPEESTFVEESVAEPEPIVEEPVAEEPVVEEPADDGGWIYYSPSSRITHYCWCSSCNGRAYQNTASGVPPTAFYTCAAGPSIPFGTEVLINGNVYVVQDRGVADDQFDIFVGEDHQLALDMGMYYAEVWIRFPQ